MLRSYGRHGDSAGEFSYPFGVAVYGEELFVTDRDNHRVQVLRLRDGVFLRQWGSEGKALGEFDWPRGIAVSGNQVFVVESHNHRIQVFDLEGRVLGVIGKGELENPIAIAIAGKELFVSDHKYRVLVFNTHGTLLRQFGSEGEGDGQFSGDVCGLAICGQLAIVSDMSNTIQLFDRWGRFLRSWRGSGSEAGQFKGLRGIAVAGVDLYVCDKGNSRLQVMRLPDLSRLG